MIIPKKESPARQTQGEEELTNSPTFYHDGRGKTYIESQPFETSGEHRARHLQMLESGRADELQHAAEAVQVPSVNPAFCGTPDEAIAAAKADEERQGDSTRDLMAAPAHAHGGGRSSGGKGRKRKKGTRVCGCGMTLCEHLSKRGPKPDPSKIPTKPRTVRFPESIDAIAAASGNASQWYIEAAQAAIERERLGAA